MPVSVLGCFTDLAGHMLDSSGAGSRFVCRASVEEEDSSAPQEFVSEENIPATQGVEDVASKEQAFQEETVDQKALEEKALNRETLDEEFTKPEVLKTDREKEKKETLLPDEATPEKAIDTEQGADLTAENPGEPSPEPSKPDNLDPPAPSRAPIVSMEPERMSPTSRLGGSARELLNADGTQR